MTTEEKDFHLKEFEALRKEIEFTLGEHYNTQRYAVLATGAVWAWLFTQKVQLTLAWAIPGLFILCGWCRQFALFEQLRKLSCYIYGLESQLMRSDGGKEVSDRGPRCKEPWIAGWEHFYHSPSARWRWAWISNHIVWLVLLVTTIAMATFAPWVVSALMSHASAAAATPR